MRWANAQRPRRSARANCTPSTHDSCRNRGLLGSRREARLASSDVAGERGDRPARHRGFNRRDLDAATRSSAPDIEVDWSRSRGVEAGVYRGQRAARDFWNQFLDMFQQVTVTAEEFIELGDQVVVPSRTRLCGRDGIEVQTRSAYVVTFRDRRIVGG